METLLLVLVLLGAGALIGSFWLEWREAPSPGVANDPARGTAPLEGRTRVEVLNGAGDRGAARELAEHLRARGFDVVYFGNADRFDHAVTRVLDRSGRERAAEEVVGVLGLDSAAIELEPELYLDATVILGADWREVLERSIATGEEGAG